MTNSLCLIVVRQLTLVVAFIFEIAVQVDQAVVPALSPLLDPRQRRLWIGFKILQTGCHEATD